LPLDLGARALVRIDTVVFDFSWLDT